MGDNKQGDTHADTEINDYDMAFKSCLVMVVYKQRDIQNGIRNDKQTET